MKHILAAIFLFLLIPMTNGQDEGLDEIFDDGDISSQFHVGTELLTFASATPNVYIDLGLAELVKLQVGVGIVPLGTYIDLMNWRPSELERPPVADSAVNIGYFMNGALKIFNRNFMISEFAFYYYAGFRRWQYSVQQNYKVTRFKGNVGGGYQFGLTGRFNVDIQFGVYLGRDKMEVDENYDPKPNWEEEIRGYEFYEDRRVNSSMMNGFDIGISLNYAI